MHCIGCLWVTMVGGCGGGRGHTWLSLSSGPECDQPPCLLSLSHSPSPCPQNRERRKYQIPKYYTSQKTSQGQQREFVLGRMPPVMEPPLNLTAVMTQMVGSTATACPCCNRSQEINHGNSNEYVAVAGEQGEPPIYIRTSEFDVSVKVGGIKWMRVLTSNYHTQYYWA